MTDATTTSRDADLDELEVEWRGYVDGPLTYSYRNRHNVEGYLVDEDAALRIPALIAELRLARAVIEGIEDNLENSRYYHAVMGEACCVACDEFGWDSDTQKHKHRPDCPLAAYLAWQAQQAQGKEET